MNIKVSVVMPVYNAEKYLRQSLASVLGQSLRDIEVICVDDGSTDGSTDILLQHAAADPRLYVVAQANSGPGKARNTGLDRASGEYVIFLDSDDWYEVNFLEEMYKCIVRNGADICVCKAEQFDSDSGRPLPSEWMLKTKYLPSDVFTPEEISEYLFQFTYGQVWDKLYRREFLAETGIIFPELRNSEDTAFAYMTLLSSQKIVVLPEVFVHYRVNVSDSVSSTLIKHPEAPYEAFRLVYEHLETMEDKELYQQSFLNWAMEYLVWHVTNMPDEVMRRRNFEHVRTVWIKKLNFDSNPVKVYQNKIVFLKYQLLSKSPFFVFEAFLLLYKAVKSL